MTLHLLYEDVLFVAIATSFFAVVGWAWRDTKPYKLPTPLPDWFKIWFLTVQLGGGVLPLIALGWSLWSGHSAVTAFLLSYFLLLGLQILSESLSLRRFCSTVFVMVPYLYLPFRIWQLYEGRSLLQATGDTLQAMTWIQGLLLFQIILWGGNYALDLSQLPRLLHWNQVNPSAISSDVSTN